jgi:hypothetical protein
VDGELTGLVAVCPDHKAILAVAGWDGSGFIVESELFEAAIDLLGRCSGQFQKARIELAQTTPGAFEGFRRTFDGGDLMSFNVQLDQVHRRLIREWRGQRTQLGLSGVLSLRCTDIGSGHSIPSDCCSLKS